jgi:hypothetical protein
MMLCASDPAAQQHQSQEQRVSYTFELLAKQAAAAWVCACVRALCCGCRTEAHYRASCSCCVGAARCRTHGSHLAHLTTMPAVWWPLMRLSSLPVARHCSHLGLAPASAADATKRSIYFPNPDGKQQWTIRIVSFRVRLAGGSMHAPYCRLAVVLLCTHHTQHHTA